MNKNKNYITLFIITAFVISRIVYFMLGVRFDSNTISVYWQFIDIQLLKTDLCRSIFYLHSQPPLFNLLLGIVLKMSEVYTNLIFNVVYLFLGLVFYVSFVHLMIKLKISTRLSIFLTIILMISPANICYENWLFYTYPIAALLPFAGFALYIYLQHQQVLCGLLFFGTLAVIVMLWGLFHPIWYLISACIVLLRKNVNKKVFTVSVLVPGMLILLILIKNNILLGTFSTTSWLGMNLSKTTTTMLPIPIKINLINKGKISLLSVVPRFSDVALYKTIIHENKKTNIPVLDNTYKANRYNNYHHLIYVAVSKQYLKDALYVIRHYPEYYLMGIKNAWTVYFYPTTEYVHLQNISHIAKFNTISNKILCGQLSDKSKVGYFLVFILPVLWVYGVYKVFKTRNINAVMLTFLLFTVLYLSVAGNMVEIGENNRFRFVINSYYLIFFGLFWEDIKKLNRKYIMQENVK